MTISGHSLIVVDMTFFDLKAGTGHDTVVMLMSVIEGYITDNSMGMAFQTGFFTGNSGQPMTVFIG